MVKKKVKKSAKSRKGVALVQQPRDVERYYAVSSPSTFIEERKRLARKNIPWSDDLRRELLERVTLGEMPTDVCAESHMPTWSALQRELAGNKAFADQYMQAISALADVSLLDATTMLRQAIDGNPNDPFNIDIKAMEIYTKSTIAAMAKLAPKSHGDLLRVTDKDLGPLSISVVRYADKAKSEKENKE